MNSHYAVRVHKNVLRALIGVAIVGAASFAGYRYAQSAPVTMSKYFVYQGRLTQPDGSPVASNTYNLQFGVYTDASATTKICDSTHDNVVVKQGVFRVSIGQGAPGATGSCGTTDMQTELATRPELWLAISVKGPNDSAYQALSPLVQVGATPRALYAANAGRAQVAGEAEGNLKAMIEAMVPAGTVAAFAAVNPPAGWLLCNGDPKKQSEYPALYAAIGTTHGNGGGQPGWFNLPDYRGRFLRMGDYGANRDPDRASRAAMAMGGNAGDSIGSLQNPSTRAPNSPFVADPGGIHTHRIAIQSCGAPGGGGGCFVAQDGFGAWANIPSEQNAPHGHTVSGGDAETRPQNAYVAYIIKY